MAPNPKSFSKHWFSSDEPEDLVKILCSGSDDRSILKGQLRVNKYHTRPLPNTSALFRASCTCNFPTTGAYKAVKHTWSRIKKGGLKVEDLAEDLRSRLKEALELPEGAQIIFTPSGSDAEYIPLMIAKAVFGNRKIVNVVTCNGEVGSGTLDGAAGKYFSCVLPLTDDSDLESIDPVPHKPIPELAKNVEAMGIKARTSDGEVYLPDEDICGILQKCKKEGSLMILHSVLGSKTGICEPDRIDDSVISVVDACQGRLDLRNIKSLLENNQFVLFTGSKFFRAPPFCGAVLVPKKFVLLVQNHWKEGMSLPGGIRNFLSVADVPESFNFWKRDLHPLPNTGLYLRWVAGLYEIEQTVGVDYEERVKSEQLWRELVTSEVSKYSSMEILPDSFATDTIISIKLRQSPSEDWMNKTELAKVYALMTQILHVPSDIEEPKTVECLGKRCFIGQPVMIGNKFAVLRIAADSELLRKLRSNPTCVEDDYEILRKINFLAENFASF